MNNMVCSCGSTNCTLLEWNNKKEGAKTGGLGGAVIGGLIGLAGGPIGAIAGAAIGAAGGAAVGKEQPTDKIGRRIEKYKCNSCGKKFEACPQCNTILHYKTTSFVTSSGRVTNKYCKKCNNYISSQTSQNANPQAAAKGAKAYGDLVKRNIENLIDDD